MKNKLLKTTLLLGLASSSLFSADEKPIDDSQRMEHMQKAKWDAMARSLQMSKHCIYAATNSEELKKCSEEERVRMESMKKHFNKTYNKN